MTNDLTFTFSPRPKARPRKLVRPTVIRPGTLTASDSLEAHYQRYFEQAFHKEKLVAPAINELLAPQTQEASAPAAAIAKRTSAPEAEAARHAGLVVAAGALASKLSGYWRAVSERNWRSLFADKHKHYAVGQGMRLRAVSFRMQSAVMVLAAVLVLASAESFAPAGKPQTADTPMPMGGPARLTTGSTPAVFSPTDGEASTDAGAAGYGWTAGSIGADSSGSSGAPAWTPSSMPTNVTATPTVSTPPAGGIGGGPVIDAPAPTPPVVAVPPAVDVPPAQPQQPSDPPVVVVPPVNPAPPVVQDLSILGEVEVDDGVTGVVHDTTDTLDNAADGLTGGLL